MNSKIIYVRSLANKRDEIFLVHNQLKNKEHFSLSIGLTTTELSPKEALDLGNALIASSCHKGDMEKFKEKSNWYQANSERLEAKYIRLRAELEDMQELKAKCDRLEFDNERLVGFEDKFEDGTHLMPVRE